MDLFETLRAALRFGQGTTPDAHPVTVIRPEAAGLEQQVLEGRNSVALAKLSEQQVYDMFLGSFVGGNPLPAVEVLRKDEVRLQTLEAFVREVFSPPYLLENAGAVSSWSRMNDEKRAVFAYIREAREHLRMPDKNGAMNFFKAVYGAELQGLRTKPPIVVHIEYRPDIVWPIRQDLFGGGLGLVRKIVRRGDAYWERAAAEQLLFMHRLAERYGVDLQQIAHQDFFDTVVAFRDEARARINLLRAQGQSVRVEEIEQTYVSTTAQLQMPIPLHTVRLPPGSTKWQ